MVGVFEGVEDEGEKYGGVIVNDIEERWEDDVDKLVMEMFGGIFEYSCVDV